MENKKIIEAQTILENLGLPESQQNKLSALTLLALAGIKPNDKWKNATAKRLTLSKDIMTFVNDYYDADYKPNSRESFRKIALNPFVNYNLAVLNPDGKLSPTSSLTNYALSDLAVETIKKYNTEKWESAVEEFKLKQFPENSMPNFKLTKFEIKNFKSIDEDKIELGRFNVFIGTNGSGKSNVLEAFAMAGASVNKEVDFEGLYGRGVRIARPNLTMSSFKSMSQDESINFRLEYTEDGETYSHNMELIPENSNDIFTNWIDKRNDRNKMLGFFIELLEEYKDGSIQLTENNFLEHIEKLRIIRTQETLPSILSEYVIYDLNTKSLRGVIPADSRRTPLGINGEGLDLLIANFNSYEREMLTKYCVDLFDWLFSISNDKEDRAKLDGLKLGRSASTLLFVDKFMQKQNNTFSAENSNEGILHVLFYLALFISNKTPKIFAIDNIETALNPKLCRVLIKLLAKLAEERGKQVLITTHNPAILDGLNLLDDDQRLFEVYRDNNGKTKTRRIKFKQDLSDKKYRLSDMWIKGLLGAVPKNF
ncbi:Predicted ATPase [Chryseobacterium taeanense]|uniref:Predicted ATPase n=1 Tax=Chryseobacterium taeanense TaxID=311334 RepID=A0A1G8LG29_9FLAO|nr:AAA family ATPase [Chryseobacterium taeanense]SDI54457.1 Predicted ATPase [Chryseobacterium taeanense]